MLNKNKTFGGLRVTDPETNRIVRAISEATGKSATSVVNQAVRESHKRLEEQRRKATVDEVFEEAVEEAKSISAHVRGSYRNHHDVFYNERVFRT
jgi:hypothetical protein